MLKDLAKRTRSVRRFQEDEPVTLSTLRDLIDIARVSPSKGNAQPLKYVLSASHDLNSRVFGTLDWFGYVKEWQGPQAGERPTAYVIILHDRNLWIEAGLDQGIAAYAILLGAAERGLGGCIVAAFNKQQLKQELGLSERYEPLLVLALGEPKEEVRVVPVGADGTIKYYRDAQGVHHVPKRQLDDLLVHVE